MTMTVIPAKKVFSALCLIAFFATSSYAEILPSEKDVSDLQQDASDTIGQMLNVSIGLRLQYHCNGAQLSKAQRTELCELATNASSKLSGIHRKQQAITKLIDKARAITTSHLGWSTSVLTAMAMTIKPNSL